jgi:hypothetical protein
MNEMDRIGALPAAERRLIDDIVARRKNVHDL